MKTSHFSSSNYDFSSRHLGETTAHERSVHLIQPNLNLIDNCDNDVTITVSFYKNLIEKKKKKKKERKKSPFFLFSVCMWKRWKNLNINNWNQLIKIKQQSISTFFTLQLLET